MVYHSIRMSSCVYDGYDWCVHVDNEPGSAVAGRQLQPSAVTSPFPPHLGQLCIPEFDVCVFQ